MGEAKRRKLLDPNFGKSCELPAADVIEAGARSVEKVIEEGVKLFPLGLLNEFYWFGDSLPEYPPADYIYEGYSEEIRKFAGGLEHIVRCEFWSFLLFVDYNRLSFEKYIKQVMADLKKSEDEALIYSWQRLSLASMYRSQYALWDDNDEEYDHEKLERWDELSDVLPERIWI